MNQSRTSFSLKIRRSIKDDLFFNVICTLLLIHLVMSIFFHNLGRVQASPYVQSLDLFAPARYDLHAFRNQRELRKNRLQYQTSLYYKVKVFKGSNIGHFNLKGLIGTGESYTSQWNTGYDLIQDEIDDQFINMRQIFIEWSQQGWRWEMGVIPPVKGKVSNTSLDKDGWIRGTRLVIPLLGQGELELVTGAIDHLRDANAFQLWESWNYYEIEWTQHWMEHWRSEAGYVQLNQQEYLRAEGRWKGTLSSFHLELAGEILRNVTTPTWAYDLSATLKMGDLTIVGEYSNVPTTFGLLGELSNDFFTLGHLGMLALKGALIKKAGVHWFTKTYLGEEMFRAMAGLGIRFNLYSR